MSNSLKYRPEIDGLRAIAVLPVIFFHAGFDFFSGGFVGVDIFFVISGFLITSILLSDLEQNNFSLSSFYDRRARRILPALFVVVLVSIPFSWMFLSESQFKDFSQSVSAVSIFSSNILFWLESGYFESASEEKPLLHTWSLAVEEQFYVFFPLLLLALWKLGKNSLLIILTVVSIISLVLCELWAVKDPNANFFLLPSRTWELFSGAIAAVLMRYSLFRPNDILAVFGLVLLVGGITVFDEHTPFPSLYTLVPVIGTLLVILYAGEGTLTNRVLSTSGLVMMGLVSYSAYLWHQPIFAFFRILSIEGLTPALKLLMVVSSVCIAYVSWKFVEAPFRNKARFSSTTIFKVSFFTLLIFFILGVLGSYYADELRPGKFNSANFYLLSEKSKTNSELREESWGLLRDKDEKQLWFDSSKQTENVLLLGNSHSKDIYNTLVHTNLNLRTFQFARYAIKVSQIPSHISKLREIPNYKVADIITIASRYDSADMDAFEEVIKLLNKDGKRVVVINNTFEFPEFRTRKWTLAEYLGHKNYQKENASNQEELASIINRGYYKSLISNNHAERIDFSGEVSSINRFLSNLMQKYPNVNLLDRKDYMCDVDKSLCFAVSADLVKYYYDYGHNSIDGAIFFAKRIDELSWFKVPLE